MPVFSVKVPWSVDRPPIWSAEAQIPEGGRKDDDNKLRYDLIPTWPLALLADVYTIGARKYDDRNWEKGIKWGRIFAAMMRHAWAWWAREERDPQDGQHHLASVAWCAFALMQYEVNRTEFDDRPLKEVINEHQAAGAAPGGQAQEPTPR